MNSVTVGLPRNLDGADVCRLVQDFIEDCPDGLPSTVVVDFTELGFIHPAGVTFLSNFIHWLRRIQRVNVELVGYERLTPASRYLDDSLFFREHLGRTLRPIARVRGTTKPLRYIHHEAIHNWLRVEFLPWLAHALGVREADLHLLQVCISEIFNNINDHSTVDIGSIFVQHFPNKNIVRIAVGDFGRGIPDLVRTARPDISDDQAIILATQEAWSICFERWSPRIEDG